MINRILIDDRQSVVKIPSGTKLLVRRSCNAVLKTEEFEYPAEISVSIVDNRDIRSMNKQYRGKDIETDVLSFPAFEDGKYIPNKESGAVALGDIVISIEKAVDQANMFGHSLQREIAYLTVHSMLHLLGYHHEEGGLQEVHVREKEEAVLRLLGLPRGLSYVPE